jgi:hypothetical protein
MFCPEPLPLPLLLLLCSAGTPPKLSCLCNRVQQITGCFTWLTCLSSQRIQASGGLLHSGARLPSFLQCSVC